MSDVVNDQPPRGRVCVCLDENGNVLACGITLGDGTMTGIQSDGSLAKKGPIPGAVKVVCANEEESAAFMSVIYAAIANMFRGDNP